MATMKYTTLFDLIDVTHWTTTVKLENLWHERNRYHGLEAYVQDRMKVRLSQADVIALLRDLRKYDTPGAMVKAYWAFVVDKDRGVGDGAITAVRATDGGDEAMKAVAKGFNTLSDKVSELGAKADKAMEEAKLAKERAEKAWKLAKETDAVKPGMAALLAIVMIMVALIWLQIPPSAVVHCVAGISEAGLGLACWFMAGIKNVMRRGKCSLAAGLGTASAVVRGGASCSAK